MAVASSMKCTPAVAPVVTIVGVVIVVAPMKATGTPPMFLIVYGLSSGFPVASLMTLASTTGKFSLLKVMDGSTVDCPPLT